MTTATEHLRTYLATRELTLERVCDALQIEFGLTEGDILYAAGSVVEGLATPTSDLDFFLVTPRTLRYTSLQDIALSVDGSPVDVRVLAPADARALVHRFSEWDAAAAPPREAHAFSPDDRMALHRMMTGVPLYGHEGFERLRGPVSTRALARHKLDWARHLFSCFQLDLHGFLLVSDTDSIAEVARIVLGHVTDALLAGHLSTNPNPKWRARLLQSVPGDWEAELGGRRTELSARLRINRLHEAPPWTLSGWTHRAAAILAFGRIVISWACRRLGVNDTPAPRRSERSRHGAVLPHLALDVILECHAGAILLVRPYAGLAIELLPPDADAVLLFDGESKDEDALGVLRAHQLEHPEEYLDTLLSRLGPFQLESTPDEDVLAVLLGR